MSQGLRQRQQELMQFLLHGDASIIDHVVVQGSVSAATRLGIYRNAYQVRLRETLDTDHPAIGTYLGDELFEQMVGGYRAQHISAHRSLRNYADALPSFLATAEPFCNHQQIAELARFERLLMTAFDAADGPRGTVQALRDIAPEQWPGMVARFHSSVQLFQSDWNVVPIWQAIKAQLAPPEATADPAVWLVWRNAELLTEFCHLSPVERVVAEQIGSTADFSATCEALLEILPEQEVSAAAVSTLVSWLEQGLIGSISTPDTHP